MVGLRFPLFPTSARAPFLNDPLIRVSGNAALFDDGNNHLSTFVLYFLLVDCMGQNYGGKLITESHSPQGTGG